VQPVFDLCLDYVDLGDCVGVGDAFFDQVVGLVESAEVAGVVLPEHVHGPEVLGGRAGLFFVRVGV